MALLSLRYRCLINAPAVIRCNATVQKIFQSFSLAFHLRLRSEMLPVHNERMLEEKTNQFCAELFVKSNHRVS